MQQTQEFVSQAQQDIAAQMQAAVAPKQARQYRKSEIADFKRMIVSATYARDELKQSLVEADKQLKTLRQCLYEAEMQHTPIEVLPPVNGPSQKARNKSTPRKHVLSNADALKIINALKAKGLLED